MSQSNSDSFLSYEFTPEEEQEILILLDEIHPLQQKVEALQQRIVESQVDMSNSRPSLPPKTKLLYDEITTLEDGKKKLEKQLFGLIVPWYRRALPGLLTKLFGPAVVNPKRDNPERITNQLNRFVEHMLEKRPDQFWRAKSAKLLRQFISVANKNLMIDVLRKEQRRRKREEVRPNESFDQDINDAQLENFYADRVRHLRKSGEMEGYIEIEVLLKELDAWTNGADLKFQQYAKVLDLHYFDGQTWDSVAVELNISRSEVFDIRKEALDELKRRIEQEL